MTTPAQATVAPVPSSSLAGTAAPSPEEILASIRHLRYSDPRTFFVVVDQAASWAQAERAYLRFKENAKRLEEINKDVPDVSDEQLLAMIDAIREE